MADLMRDKYDVLKPLVLPAYSAERYQGQDGDWVLLAVLQMRQNELEAVPVLAYEAAPLLQRYRSVAEIEELKHRHSAVRVAGGWALNLRTGETVRIKAR